MVRTFKIFLLAVVFSFLWGLWWATKDKIAFLQPAPPESISVLTPEGFLNSELLSLTEAEGLKLDVTTRPDDYDLLREILSPGRTYDVIIFPSTLTASLQLSNYFAENFSEKRFDDLNVSIDFRSLNFDSENRYLAPLLWIVNGWALKNDDPDFSLRAFLQQNGTSSLAAIPTAANLYGILQKLSPEAHSLFQTSNEEELSSVLSRFKKNIGLREQDVGPWAAGDKTLQVPHTLTPELHSHGFVFSLPMEKADLVLALLGISKTSKNPQQADRFVSLIYENRFMKELVKANQWASTKNHERTKTLFPEVFQSNYIRSLPISRLGLLSYHEAFEPLFTQFLKENYSAVLKERPKP